MINLLPDETKKQLRAARMNVLLLRYILIVTIAAGFLALLLFGSLFLLDQTKQSAQTLIDANDTQAAAYSSTQAELKTLSEDLTAAKTILDNEVFYSTALTKLGQLMPAGTVIGELNLNQAAFSQPTELKVYATSSSELATLRSVLQQSPLLRSVTFQRIAESGDGIEGYPVSVTVSLIFNGEATR